MKPTLVDEFDHYSAWRDAVRLRVETLRDWLNAQELADAESDLHLDQLLGRLQDDTLYVAFVAEFSRGKSELINAIFFADFGQRMLPSSAGRTTMCPTELSYEPSSRPRCACCRSKPGPRAAASPTAMARRAEKWTALAARHRRRRAS